MSSKLFLIKEKQSKVLLYNKKTEIVTECQKVNGDWCVLREGHTEPLLQEEEFFRLIVENGWFRHKKKEYIKSVFKTEVAQSFLRQGYIVLDTVAFTSFKLVDGILINAMEVPNLPEGFYILYPFQNFIPLKAKEKNPVKSERKIEWKLTPKRNTEFEADRQKIREEQREARQQRATSTSVETSKNKKVGGWRQYLTWENSLAAALCALTTIGVSCYMTKNKTL